MSHPEPWWWIQTRLREAGLVFKTVFDDLFPYQCMHGVGLNFDCAECMIE